MNLKQALKVYAITDYNCLKDKNMEAAVLAAIKGGATIVQYREKELPHMSEDRKQQKTLEAKKLCEICKAHGVLFLVNDYVDLAKEIGADGVHLGAKDMDLIEARKILGENAIIGATAKTIEQAKEAEKAGADYLGSGAVFGTTTKLDAKPMCKELLSAIVDSVTIPVVAIGGIQVENVLALKDTRISGVAVVSGIFASEDIEKTTRELRQKVESFIKNEISE